jgi:LAO/AO transport system kinase
MSDSSFNINPLYRASEKKLMDASYYINGVVKGDRFVLGETITIVESQDPIKKSLARSIISALPKSIQSIRLAITGAPGVGKSTFIENFGNYLANKGESIAVLAIDPSSYEHKGSVLGDKTRMANLSEQENVFIRPSSAGELLGGVSRGTKETILLCEAAGYKYIFIETVGVGQSEYWGAQISDFTLNLIQPGSGDELQGIKRGLLEMSDFILVNKSDSGQEEAAKLTAQAYRSVIGLLPSKINGYNRVVLNISSTKHTGFDLLIDHLEKIYLFCHEEGLFKKSREKQEAFWFEAMLKEEMFSTFLNDPSFNELIKKLNSRFEEDGLDATSALNQINLYFQNLIHKNSR